jgi:hypothetical protein
MYEYISVPKATYVKMVNAASPGRFAKDIFLSLLLGENNKPRLEYSTIKNTKALL